MIKPYEIILSKNLKAILDEEKITIQSLKHGSIVKEIILSFSELDKLNIHTKYLRRRKRQEKKEMIF